MPGPSIHELLGLPSDASHPNAYQVFGLALGESDQQVIRAAIERRIKTIKQAKSATEPDVWMKAVKAVQAAQKVLSDPEQKASLDAKYGILSDPSPAPADTPAEESSADPLAALLPGSSPPSTNGPHTGPRETAPTQPREAQPLEASQPNTPATPAAATPRRNTGIQVSDDSRRSSRRRGSGGLIFGSIVVVMLGLIVAGLGYLFINGGTIQLVKGDQGLQVGAGKSAAPGRSSRMAAPQAGSQRERGDGIMTPAPRTPAPRTPAPTAPPAESMPAPAEPSMPAPQRNNAEPPMTPETSSPEMPAPPDGTTDTGSPSGGMTADMPNPSAAPTPPAPTPPGPQRIASADAALSAARDAIAGAEWDSMKTLSETAEKQAVTAAQKQAAETLYQFADLAMFYRSGIEKAMSELVAGNEFKLTDSLTFLVQRSSAEQITLYRNKREYTYTLDELPLSVAHALAPFGLDAASNEGQAAMAVFQTISPKTTAGHRAQSIDILRGLGDVEGADPQKLADFIGSLDDR
ncbi:hypothetical protein [Allorhodopirellula solitaria]|uniref:DnaJ domain protein n=1 Tax=Allorhodopirellula solitaria TaxID=2527987 RepID=A0A5C5XRC0_9BACT|nr:hypothetical protein [Allorhodopirellula solitaria]TWT64903.1 hypothetical protein CA85_36880 [Allorhodopirellula solitaria]